MSDQLNRNKARLLQKRKKNRKEKSAGFNERHQRLHLEVNVTNMASVEMPFNKVFIKLPSGGEGPYFVAQLQEE